MLTYSVAALAFGTLALGQPTKQFMNLTDAIVNTPSLSTFAGYLERNPSALAEYSSAQNVTCFAASDTAWTAFLSSPQNLTASNATITDEWLKYALINGTYPSSSFSTVPKFLQTRLIQEVSGGAATKVVNVDNATYVFGGDNVNATVVTADIPFNGGVLHVVDTKYPVPQQLIDTARDMGLIDIQYAAKAGLSDLLNQLASVPDSTALTSANDAFAAAVAQTTTAFTPQDLIDITNYNLVNGTVIYSTDFTEEGFQMGTVYGEPVTFKLIGGVPTVNGIEVIFPDTLVENGVLHQLNGFLTPLAGSPVPSTGAAPSTSASGPASAAT